MRTEQDHHRGLQANLDRIIRLLDKQALEQTLLVRQQGARPDLVQGLTLQQQRVELQQRLRRLHPADIAYIVERLAPAQRGDIWELIETTRRGPVLIELSGPIQKDMARTLSIDELHAATQALPTDDLAELLASLPEEIAAVLLERRDEAQRGEIESVLAFPEGSAGALMDYDHVIVREDVTVEVVLRFLRRRRQLPEHTNQLFVTNHQGVLVGLLSLPELLVCDAEATISQLMTGDPVYFYTDERASEVADAFERYDLITAPVVNLHRHPVGRITVDAVLDYRSEAAQSQSLKQVGLSADEDMFAPVWQASRNRWLWLGLNLATAFVASRVIGAFEATIQQLVALAALMPIVASIGGNTGNQTSALFIRGLALRRFESQNLRHLISREMRIGFVNGCVWGLPVGLAAWVLYGQIGLGLVMLTAMVANMSLAALAGALIPIGLARMGRDPVMGSSVILTGITDSLGFLIFLGLAHMVLLG